MAPPRPGAGDNPRGYLTQRPIITPLRISSVCADLEQSPDRRSGDRPLSGPARAPIRCPAAPYRGFTHAPLHTPGPAVRAPDVAVLASSDAAVIAEDLRAAGAVVSSWTGPRSWDARRSGLLLRTFSATPGWGLAMAARTIVTMWPSGPHLDAAAPHLLPYLTEGTAWLQLGPHRPDASAALAARAADRAVTVLHAPAVHTPGGGLALSARHRTALLRRPHTQPVRDWITRIPPAPGDF